MEKFREQLKLKSGLTLKNRFVMAPMTIKMSLFDGEVSRDELYYYSLRNNGFGAVITAASNVSELGRAWKGGLGISNDDMVYGLNELSSTIKSNGAKAIIQIFHAGRMSNSKVVQGKQTVAPSAIKADRDGAEMPKELSSKEVYNIIDDFKRATSRAIQAGFDGVELHGANTYLIQQFFSPHSNQRDDEFGGSLEKRFKFIDLLVDGVLDVVEEEAERPFAVGYRFSPEEFEKPGITFEDTLYLVNKLADKDLDYLHVSLNDYQRVSIHEDYQDKTIVEYLSDAIEDRLPLISVGGITTAEDASEALKHSELVAVGKSVIIDPTWTSKVLNNKSKYIKTHLSSEDKYNIGLSNGSMGFLKYMLKDKIV